ALECRRLRQEGRTKRGVLTMTDENEISEIRESLDRSNVYSLWENGRVVLAALNYTANLESLELIGRCENLEDLDLSGAGCLDEDLLALHSLHNLEKLNLSATKVSGEALRHWELPRLQKLRLNKCKK